MPNSNHLSLRIMYTRTKAKDLYQDGLSYATPQAAGMDLRACITEPELCIAPNERVVIPTGIAVQPMHMQVAGFVYSRSGLGAKRGLCVAQGVGVIDSDYRGEIIVVLLNTSQEMQIIKRGERVAQLVYQPILQAQVQLCQSLDSTERGSGGFGHTGKD